MVFVRSISFFLMFFFFFSGCTTSREKAYNKKKTEYLEIQKNIASGKIENAIIILKKRLTEHPDDIEDNVLYSTLLILSGDYKTAKEVTSRVLGQNPDNTAALYNKAILEGIGENPDSEIKTLNKILKIEPANATAAALLGKIYLNKKDLTRAEYFLKKALKNDGNNIEALEGFVSLLLRQKKSKETIKLYDKIEQLDPDYPFLYLDRGKAKMEKGDYAGAKKDFTTAIKKDPSNYWNYLNRGKVKAKHTGEYDSALEDFNKAEEINPDYYNTYYYKAKIYDENGDLKKASRNYKKLLSLKPGFRYAYVPYAVVRFLLEDWETASLYFKKAYAANNTSHALALFTLLCYRRAGKEKTAGEYVRTVAGKIQGNKLYYPVMCLLNGTSSADRIINIINKEKNKENKVRLTYFLGSFYLLEGKERLAQACFSDVEINCIDGMIEGRLAKQELDKYRKGGESSIDE